MSNVVELAAFYLKKGALVPDFMLASDKMQSEFLAKQKGFISRKLVADGDKWADLVVWETMEAAKEAQNAFCDNAAAMAYGSFLCQDEGSCEMQHFTVVKDY